MIQTRTDTIIAGWKETTLDEVAEFSNGRTSPKRFDSGKYKVFGSNGVIGFSDKTNAPKNTIVIGRVGSYCGSLYFSKNDCWVTDNAIRANAKETSDPFYLYYLLVTQKLNSRAVGSGQPLINQEILNTIDVLLPSLPEQKAIATVLSSFDDKIELLRRQNKNLEKIAQTIFKEWFVNFTVNGKKLRIDNSTDLPEGWTQKGLDEIAEFLNGLALQKYPPENEADAIPVIKIRELKSGISGQTDKASTQIAPQYIVDNGDVLFSWSGSLEIVLWCYGKGALNQHLFKVTSKKYPKWFYFHWILKHLPFFKSIAEAKATTMGHIRRHHLAESLVVVPDSDFMAFADSEIRPVFEHIISNNSQIQTLSRLRDSLLPKLMKGEIRVKT